MIVEYHRPDSIEKALKLLARDQPDSLVLAGGTSLIQTVTRSDTPVALIDIQCLPISEIKKEGQQWHIGAGVTLQSLYNQKEFPLEIHKSLEIEAGANQRQVATVAGSIISCSGRSSFVTALLALDSQLLWHSPSTPAEIVQPLGEFLALRDVYTHQTSGKLMVSINFSTNVKLAFHSVARTPLDLPVVCVALARWPSGRTRLALGGFGLTPILALDGPGFEGIALAARSAYQAAGDEWASAEYRARMAEVIAERLLQTPEMRAL